MSSQNASDFTIRIRFFVPPGERIGIAKPECLIIPDEGSKVILKTGDSEGTPIKDSSWLLLRSSGWPTEREAEAATDQLLDALRQAQAYHLMGADLGRRAPKASFTRAGLKWLSKMVSEHPPDEKPAPILNDAHGPMVFPTEPAPKFGRSGPAIATRTVQGDRWLRTFTYALSRKATLSDRERTAFDLLSAAHVVTRSADARFVLLFAALECMIEEKLRPQEALDHVDYLIRLTKDSSIEESEKNSILGSLIWMRSHSIKRSGQNFVKQYLNNRKYKNKNAEIFFDQCYIIRNRLLHGAQPFPTYQEVSELVADLDRMVSNLLAWRILDFNGP